MIDEKTLTEQYGYICTLLEERRLKEALAQLEALLWQYPNWNLRSALEQLQTSYSYMLDYMKQGTMDPGRIAMHRQLLEKAWRVADTLRVVNMDTSSPKYYFQMRRHYLQQSQTSAIAKHRGLYNELMSFADEAANIGQLTEEQRYALLQRHDQTLNELFLTIWSSNPLNEEEEAAARELLDSDTVREEDLGLFISALTMSLFEYFDLRKVILLVDAYRHQEVGVSQRALVGFVIILFLYRDRLLLYPELVDKISLMADELPALRTDVACVYRQLLLCQETEKIEKKMREEIIPEMIKTVSTMKNIRFGGEEGDEDNELNPDWTNAFEQSGLGDKMREMNELQLEGADVYMSTFAALKNFPFFNAMPNWFYPFSRWQADIYKAMSQSELGKSKILDLIARTGFFSNSDKYSFFFTVLQMSGGQRQLLLNQLVEQDEVEELAEETNAASLRAHGRRPSTVSNQYLHDLYRFFKLNVRRGDFWDFFKEKLDLHHVPILSEMLCNKEVLLPVADFLIRKEHWTEAIDLYQELDRRGYFDADDAETYQKYGFALQKSKRYAEAIEVYRKSDALRPDNVWNNRHLATCYRMNRDYQAAIAYYEKVAEAVPEDTGVVFYISSCLAELGRYDEALNGFFKLDFMQPDSLKAWRGIGWCSLVLGKLEQAMRYYQQILERKPLSMDYMNAGHVAWVMGDIPQAANLYGKALATGGSKRAAFIEMFDKDIATLLKLGINEDDIPLMLDLI
ncbi:MAG: tetratricopeptide repeat protein [Mediterranea sp.]|jgi:tetratricopeptide (TPR) repeat protein|nr:tetratricopeptide repeat protein [Mediterranea sp.]